MSRGTERTTLRIVIMFASVTALVCLISLSAMIYFTVVNPNANVTLFHDVFLVTLGYIVGILSGLLGLKKSTD